MAASFIEITRAARRSLDDGVLDEAELGHLLSLAMRDGVVDDEEREVLGLLFDRLPPSSLADGVREEIAGVRARFGIQGRGWRAGRRIAILVQQ